MNTVQNGGSGLAVFPRSRDCKTISDKQNNKRPMKCWRGMDDDWLRKGGEALERQVLKAGLSFGKRRPGLDIATC
jgi:hypothetical protein